MLDTLYKSFWDTEYWIPPGYTWDDLEDSDGIIYPHPKDLWAAIPLTFVLTVIRYGFEWFIGLPLSRAMGVHSPIRMKAIPNPILESFFRTHSKNPQKDKLNYLASHCGLSVRQVQRWFRHRRNQERPLISKKFSESCWRFLFYSSSFFGGLSIFCNETWFWDLEIVLRKYPKLPLHPAMYWWYLFELSFYLSLVFTLSFDVKRKDFREQIIHHFVTITLISFSYCVNFVHIGSLVLLLYDVSDVFMESYKMFSYAQWSQARDTTFIIFTLVFLFCRLILFPIKVLYAVYHFVVTRNMFFFGYYFAIGLLLVLQCLNIFWAFLILKMFYNFLSDGQAKNDVRSDIEEQDTSDE
ncbi:ceramide synthase 4-like [Gracilinanus agilis]|uniref:ceramide synthase 4-like n=1 Tax=Gracilinanus agilis TaxID=191870 RepID=UPI001CFCB2A5|nr:ceramide synthase 4-like [Gracilinanus agilis]